MPGILPSFSDIATLSVDSSAYSFTASQPAKFIHRQKQFTRQNPADAVVHRKHSYFQLLSFKIKLMVITSRPAFESSHTPRILRANPPPVTRASSTG